MALQGSDYFVIERAGAVYHTLGSDILAYVEENIGTSQFDVADITARNAISNLSIGDRVFVLDASADATVSTGWAIYVWRGAAFTKVAEEEGLDVVAGGANLGYTASPTQGTVTSSSGTNATIPVANVTNAGLMVPAQFDKLGNITVTGAVNLDTLAGASHAAVTLGGTTNSNPLTLSGQTLNFSISQLTAAP
ncbi:hypothetical protein [Roseovarius ramblicola]|uniref:Uncharacterized protein n=1 Tax=Roseovarius ramblicola TaxID=2022336 RepID=A0ABV5I4H2_9RHOB